MSNYQFIFGLRFYFTSLNKFVESLFSQISKKNQEREPKLILPTTVNEIVTAFFSDNFRGILQKFDYLVTDGMPLVFFSKLIGGNSERIYGPDLMLAVINQGQKENVTHFLYGNTSQTLKKLKKKLLARFPKAKFVGEIAPPFSELSEDEEVGVIKKINQAKPDFLWVSLGGEKQARWAVKMKSKLKAKYIIPVGAAFDFISGEKKQAPRWMQDMGLEWFFRLITEPARLWRRYLLQIPVFLVLSLIEFLNIALLNNHKNRK